MSTNEWITDRLPTLAEWYVYDRNGAIVPAHVICTGEPWKPIPPCEPYVKPKRYEVRWEHFGNGKGCWVLCNTGEYGGREVLIIERLTQNNDEHREAAKRIAAIYKEVVP